MLEYNYFVGLSIPEINVLGEDNWDVIGIVIRPIPDPPTFNVFVKRGFQDSILITDSISGNNFYIDKNISYFDGFLIFLIFGAIIFLICKKLIKFFYQQL